MSLGRLAAFTFMLGAALLLVFDPPVIRVAALILLFAGLGAGAFAIATPEFLAGEGEED